MTSPRLFDLTDRTQIELRGDDRASFLHNLCTNEIRKLPAGAGTEAFLLDAKGHVLGFVNVYCRPDSLVLETVPGQGPRLLAHLDRYLIREKVELHDRTDTWAELLLDGPEAATKLNALSTVAMPARVGDNLDAQLAGISVSVRAVDFTGAGGLLLSCAREQVEPLRSALVAADCVPVDATTFEATRIEAGTPLYGVDITEKNLPQEVARDARAISFVKGCYLGQETVARIDALGHVNKTLCGVRFAGSEIPPAGTELTADGKPAGEVTSAALSPRLGTPLALAYLRRGSNPPGTQLGSSIGPAEVVTLPFS